MGLPMQGLCFILASFIYLEMLFAWIFRSLLGIGTLYSVLFAIPAGTLVYILSSVFRRG